VSFGPSEVNAGLLAKRSGTGQAGATAIVAAISSWGCSHQPESASEEKVYLRARFEEHYRPSSRCAAAAAASRRDARAKRPSRIPMIGRLIAART